VGCVGTIVGKRDGKLLGVDVGSLDGAVGLDVGGLDGAVGIEEGLPVGAEGITVGVTDGAFTSIFLYI
jgi:hypothetical protein